MRVLIAQYSAMGRTDSLRSTLRGGFCLARFKISDLLSVTGFAGALDVQDFDADISFVHVDLL